MRKHILILIVFSSVLLMNYGCGESTNFSDSNVNVTNLTSIQKDSLLNKYEHEMISGDTIGINEGLNQLLIYGNILNVSFLCRMAIIKAQFKNTKSAIRILNKAKLLNKNYSEIYYTEGLVYSFIYPIDSTIRFFNQAINDSPDSIKYLLARARIYDKMNKDSFALLDAEKAIQLQSENLEANSLKASFLGNLHKWKETIPAATIAINLIEKNNEVKHYEIDKLYYARALSYFRLNNFKASIQDVNSAIKLSPKRGAYYSLRGLAKNQLGDKESCVEDFKKGMELGDEDGATYYKQYLDWQEKHKKYNKTH